CVEADSSVESARTILCNAHARCRQSHYRLESRANTGIARDRGCARRSAWTRKLFTQVHLLHVGRRGAEAWMRYSARFNAKSRLETSQIRARLLMRAGLWLRGVETDARHDNVLAHDSAASKRDSRGQCGHCRRCDRGAQWGGVGI